MVKTQVQIPEKLYQEVKRVAREREMSLAEVVRRGLEYMVRVYPELEAPAEEWSPPAPHRLGRIKAPVEEWRMMANSPEDRS